MSAETNQPGQAAFSAEDAKLVTLARAARARTGAAEAAALRDTTGRTYVAVAVDLPSLRLPALAAVVVVALASGVADVEAAAVVGVRSTLSADDTRVIADLATGIPVYLAAPDGEVRATVVV